MKRRCRRIRQFRCPFIQSGSCSLNGTDTPVENLIGYFSATRPLCQRILRAETDLHSAFYRRNDSQTCLNLATRARRHPMAVRFQISAASRSRIPLAENSAGPVATRSPSPRSSNTAPPHRRLRRCTADLRPRLITHAIAHLPYANGRRGPSLRSPLMTHLGPWFQSCQRPAMRRIHHCSRQPEEGQAVSASPHCARVRRVGATELGATSNQADPHALRRLPAGPADRRLVMTRTTKLRPPYTDIEAARDAGPLVEARRSAVDAET